MCQTIVGRLFLAWPGAQDCTCYGSDKCKSFLNSKLRFIMKYFLFRDPKTERQFQEIGKFFICVDVCEDGFTGKRVAFIVPMVLIGMAEYFRSFFLQIFQGLSGSVFYIIGFMSP